MSHGLVIHSFTAILLCEVGDVAMAKRLENVKRNYLISLTLLTYLMVQNHSGFICQGFMVMRTDLHIK